MRDRKPEAAGRETGKERTQFCNRCEAGWLYRVEDGETLARPCPCNAKGQADIAEYAADLESQEWYRAWRKDTAERKVRAENPEAVSIFADPEGMQSAKDAISERLSSLGDGKKKAYLAEVERYRDNGSKLTPDQEVRASV